MFNRAEQAESKTAAFTNSCLEAPPQEVTRERRGVSVLFGLTWPRDTGVFLEDPGTVSSRGDMQDTSHGELGYTLPCSCPKCRSHLAPLVVCEEHRHCSPALASPASGQVTECTCLSSPPSVVLH